MMWAYEFHQLDFQNPCYFSISDVNLAFKSLAEDSTEEVDSSRQFFATYNSKAWNRVGTCFKRSAFTCSYRFDMLFSNHKQTSAAL